MSWELGVMMWELGVMSWELGVMMWELGVMFYCFFGGAGEFIHVFNWVFFSWWLNHPVEKY